MNPTRSNIDSQTTLVLKINLFNDEVSVNSSLLREFTDEISVVDIGETVNANFTDGDWDRILNNILSSSKVITV